MPCSHCRKGVVVVDDDDDYLLFGTSGYVMFMSPGANVSIYYVYLNKHNKSELKMPLWGQPSNIIDLILLLYTRYEDSCAILNSPHGLL